MSDKLKRGDFVKVNVKGQKYSGLILFEPNERNNKYYVTHLGPSKINNFISDYGTDNYFSEKEIELIAKGGN